MFNLLETYHIAIARNILGTFEGQLVYYEPITTITNHICRIVIPTSLRRSIFNMIQAIRVDGHMGEYKTLYRIKLNLF